MTENFFDDTTPPVSITEIADLRLLISRLEDEVQHIRDELTEWSNGMAILMKRFRNRL